MLQKELYHNNEITSFPIHTESATFCSVPLPICRHILQFRSSKHFILLYQHLKWPGTALNYEGNNVMREETICSRATSRMDKNKRKKNNNTTTNNNKNNKNSQRRWTRVKLLSFTINRSQHFMCIWKLKICKLCLIFYVSHIIFFCVRLISAVNCFHSLFARCYSPMCHLKCEKFKRIQRINVVPIAR